jgi:uridine kinase
MIAGGEETLMGGYQDLAREVLRRPARLGDVRLVAVDGASGAGKTILARRLAIGLAAIVTPVPVVHTDDLLDGWDDQLTFWDRLDSQILAPLRAGRPGRYRRFDWDAKRFGDELVPVPPAPVLVLEGFSSARAQIRPELTMAVFVTVPPVVGLQRALARDGTALLPYLEQWQRVAERHFAEDATEREADLVVDGAAEPGGIDVALGLRDHRHREHHEEHHRQHDEQRDHQPRGEPT